MSSFNTPCTDSKCFIPLTCLYACFVLPPLIKVGRGGKQLPKYSQQIIPLALFPVLEQRIFGDGVQAVPASL